MPRRKKKKNNNGEHNGSGDHSKQSGVKAKEKPRPRFSDDEWIPLSEWLRKYDHLVEEPEREGSFENVSVGGAEDAHSSDG